MARLPDPTGQRPIPRFGGALRAPDISPVGEATAQLGANIAGFGETLAKIKIRDDKYKTEDATTKLQSRMLDLAKGENGYSNVKSGDINDTFYEDQMARYDSANKEIADSLSNDEQRQMFMRRSAVARNGYAENLINHITREKDVFNKQVYEGGIATERDLATSDYDNENEVNRALLRTEKLTEAEAERQGWKGDLKKQVLKENKSAIHEGVIRQAVDDGNHEYAKDWYKKHQKDILGERQDEIGKLLRESGIREKSQQYVDDYVSRGMTESEAKAEARKLDPEERDATIARINIRYGEAAQALDREQKAAGEEAWSIYSETGDIDQIPVSVLRKMDGKERAALQTIAEKEAAGTDVKTDFKTYYGLRQLAANNPTEFRKLNLMAYADKLSPADREEMVKLQTDEPKAVMARTKTQILNQGAVNAGFDPKHANKDTTKGEELRAYYRRVDDEVAAFQASTGKEPTTKDMSDIVDRLSLQVIRDPGAWFFKGERPAVSAQIEGVPDEMVDELANSLFRAGVPITDINIQKLYLRVSK